MKPTKDEMVARLRKLIVWSKDDEEMAHDEADKLLLAYIDDEQITSLFDEIHKWYA